MANPITDLYRLAKAGLTLTYYGVALFPSHLPTPWPVKLLRVLLFPFKIIGGLLRAPFGKKSTSERLVTALTKLGPSYIKLGQFLATRPDIIGAELASNLSPLQDNLPPFSQEEAIQEVERQLGKPINELFVDFSAPIAAASIAQVHKATLLDQGQERQLAVKILRPDIERRFENDQAAYRFGAKMIELFSKQARRLKPVEVVKTLDRTVTLELDLRLEGAALSELAQNTQNDKNVRIPRVEWGHTTQRVLTSEWIDATPIADIETLKRQGHDLTALGTHVLQSFLKQAMRDGFFHADMHPGNLMVDSMSNLVMLDCGIMGRLSPKERRFLAEILHGFVTGDYRQAALAHFEAGYVPAHHSIDEFAQGLRAIGEPIADRPASEISMARFLGQLLEYTAVYDMETRPELILLQKNLVVAEGVARSLNSDLNLWRVAEPVVKEWLTDELGPASKMRKVGAGLKAIDHFLDGLPDHLLHLEQDLDGLAKFSRGLQSMDETAIANLLTGQSKHSLSTRIALWISAISLAGLAINQLL